MSIKDVSDKIHDSEFLHDVKSLKEKVPITSKIDPNGFDILIQINHYAPQKLKIIFYDFYAINVMYEEYLVLVMMLLIVFFYY